MNEKPTVILANSLETDVQLIECSRPKPGSSLFVATFLHVWLKRGTSLEVRLCRGRGPGRVVLDFCALPSSSAGFEVDVRLRALDCHPPYDGKYVVTAQKVGRWSVGCTPKQSQWQELAR